MQGDYRRGFEGYEARWDLPEFTRRHVGVPSWDGDDLTGKRILILAEQGYGDIFQMARFLPILARQAGEVVVETYDVLVPLIRELSCVSETVMHGDPLPGADIHAPVMSLPHLLKTDLTHLPADVPYLCPPARKTADIDCGETRLKVGIFWRGRPSPNNFLGRPCPIEAFSPVAAMPEIALFSLQVGNAVNDLKSMPWRDGVIDLGSGFQDFGDTAAAIAALDLVVTIDTAVAHLAGALGAPTWTLLSQYADWRWLRDRDDSPWYPTMRLFRQTQAGEWGDVLESAVAALKERLR